MAIRQADHNMQSRIPSGQFLRFRLARGLQSVTRINERHMERELAKEASLVQRLKRDGKIEKGKGLEAFCRRCKEKLDEPGRKRFRFTRTRKHSIDVRDSTFKIALEHQERRKSQGARVNATLLDVIANTAGYHDIGKTMLAEYLLNREDGTVLGIGKGSRIDPETELPVLRLAHVVAGVKLLRLYKEFMSEEEYFLAKLIIGGHHIAFDGIGSASAPSYPGEIGGTEISGFIKVKGARISNRLPDIVKIIRTADVYSACLENRFYLSQSERLIEMAQAEGVRPEDAALGLTITVAGVDVDPRMVAYLIMSMYDVSFDSARELVHRLHCRDVKSLRERRGKDIDWTLTEVLRRRRFLKMVEKSKKKGGKVDTGLFRLAGDMLAATQPHAPSG